MTRGLDVINADADMSKAFLWVRIAVGHFEGIVILGAVIVGQLQQAFVVGPMGASGQLLGRFIAQKVEVELIFGKWKLLDLLHAEKFIVFH